jgi:hypothetical protein
MRRSYLLFIDGEIRTTGKGEAPNRCSQSDNRALYSTYRDTSRSLRALDVNAGCSANLDIDGTMTRSHLVTR